MAEPLQGSGGTPGASATWFPTIGVFGRSLEPDLVRMDFVQRLPA